MIEHVLVDAKKDLVLQETTLQSLTDLRKVVYELILMTCEDRNLSNALKTEMVVNVEEKMEKSAERQTPEKKKSFLGFSFGSGN